MTRNGWFQILVFLIAILAVTAPIGRFMTRVFNHVNEKAASYRAREGLDPALIPEHVMVCMSSNALAPRVIRTGARIAGRLGATWYAVYVETPQDRPGRMAPRDSDALEKNIRLAESLGATVVRVKAERPAEGLIAFLASIRDAAVQVVPIDG